MTSDQARRTGDEVRIGGDYQYRALNEGPTLQRFWHHSKQIAIAQLLPPAPGDFVLDIGCGSGIISDFLARSGATVLGIDGNHQAITFAREQFGRAGVDFHEGLVDEQFAVERPVDKVYCLELIEHIYTPQAQALMEHARGLLHPGGEIFVTTPNYRSAWPVIEWVMDHTGVAPELGGAQHVDHYHAPKLRDLMTASGFEVRTIVTKCGLAPWAAPLNWGWAERLQQRELSSRHLTGSILVCVARVPDRRSD